MKYNFDLVVNRRNTNSYKWDQTKQLFGDADILPLWVADMDFESPPAVKEALIKRAMQGTYGYTIRSSEYEAAIVNWFARRHGWSLEPAWLADVPGVVTALSLAIDLCSAPGEQVILQSPVYNPFYDVIRLNGRKIAESPLIINNGRYEMDYGHLEQLMKQGAKTMLLCSPHNPVGRVWEREELQKLSELCLKYNVLIISDEIHCDLVLPGYKHIPFASLSEEIAAQTVTATAPTKTFNLPGLQSSFVAISNRELKRRFDDRLKMLSLHSMPYFNVDAVTAAYNDGEEWLDELLVYLQGNVQFAIDYLERHLPQVKAIRPEGTYLLWVDYRNLVGSAEEIKDLMFKQAKVAFTEGSIYGETGLGYIRINYACPRSVLHEALERFCRAAQTKVR
ncbi:MalY/PatB family protein [Paenibacillus sp. MSJ-34]|uniref:MalY/PatB family protein n=1 Tax=Paenibacillus sp. MSJ-34 TaxID=2841529 RepID=UPI001C119612|nr:MalY/PatB family protein [Paenibacillus sp. MSJ-34]MBU5444071.1 pyridoxal phosphate-dependent aminotransferase [Paenibacillus sp. MSJ-34]